MKNNKGFTLIETLAIIMIITIIGTLVLRNVGETLSISKKESYHIMKNNIISSSYDYLKECSANISVCNLQWQNNQTTFNASQLENSGYFKNLYSPIDNKYLGDCLKIHVVKDDVNFNVAIEDKCY